MQGCVQSCNLLYLVLDLVLLFLVFLLNLVSQSDQSALGILKLLDSVLLLIELFLEVFDKFVV